MGFVQGWFKPQNPEKYRGNVDKIRYLSSWERDFDAFLDRNPNILEWWAEPFPITYIKPTDRKPHRYYPDYWIKYKKADGTITQEIIEIKPYSQVHPPRKVGKRRKQQVYETLTHLINTAKWGAAQKFCTKYNMKFRILTEKQLYGIVKK